MLPLALKIQAISILNLAAAIADRCGCRIIDLARTAPDGEFIFWLRQFRAERKAHEKQLKRMKSNAGS